MPDEEWWEEWEAEGDERLDKNRSVARLIERFEEGKFGVSVFRGYRATCFRLAEVNEVCLKGDEREDKTNKYWWRVEAIVGA